MTNGRLWVTALASVTDPAWRGEIEAHLLEDRAYLFTDIYLGAIRFSVVTGPHTAQVETRSAHTAIFGCLYMVARRVASGEGRSVVPDYVGNELVLSVAGDEVRLMGNGQEIVTRRTDLLLRLDEAFVDALALVRAGHGDRPHPPPLDDMAAAVSAWAAEVRSAAGQ